MERVLIDGGVPWLPSEMKREKRLTERVVFASRTITRPPPQHPSAAFKMSSSIEEQEIAEEIDTFETALGTETRREVDVKGWRQIEVDRERLANDWREAEEKGERSIAEREEAARTYVDLFKVSWQERLRHRSAHADNRIHPQPILAELEIKGEAYGSMHATCSEHLQTQLLPGRTLADAVEALSPGGVRDSGQLEAKLLSIFKPLPKGLSWIDYFRAAECRREVALRLVSDVQKELARVTRAAKPSDLDSLLARIEALPAGSLAEIWYCGSTSGTVLGRHATDSHEARVYLEQVEAGVPVNAPTKLMLAFCAAEIRGEVVFKLHPAIDCRGLSYREMQGEERLLGEMAGVFTTLNMMPVS